MGIVQDRIKYAMEIRQFRQVDLIERTGISSPRISQYLSGRNNPKQDAAYLLAKALSVNPGWLMGFDEPMEYVTKENVTGRERDLIINYRKLDEYDKGRLAAYIDIFLADEKYKKGSVVS